MAIIFNKQQEQELLQAAKMGKQDAFASLYDAYAEKIYNFIYFKVLHQETAEDISTDTFLKAWEKLQQFKGDNFAAWLYTIARNKVTDYYRQKKDNYDIDDCWDLSDGQDLLAQVDTSLQFQNLQKALAHLNREDRELLIMRFWQDLSFAEIAEILGKKQGAVKMACGRAVKKLQTKLPLPIFIILPSLITLCKKIN